jgi:hypothetical protein
MPSDAFAAFEVVEGLDAPRRKLPQSRRREAAPVSETSVRSGVVAHFELVGGVVIVKHQTELAVRGTPDLLGCINGRCVVVECKRVGYVPTAAQLGQLRRWQRAGALACWVQSVEHFQQVLTHLHDPEWVNDFAHPGDGRDADAAW